MRLFYVMIDICIPVLYIYVHIGDVHWVDGFELFLHSILDIQLLRICHLKKTEFKWLYIHTVKDLPERLTWVSLLISIGFIWDLWSFYMQSFIHHGALTFFFFFPTKSKVFLFTILHSKQKNHDTMDWCQVSIKQFCKEGCSKEVRTVQSLYFCCFLQIPWTNSKRSGLCIWEKLCNTRQFRWKCIKGISELDGP